MATGNFVWLIKGTRCFVSKELIAFKAVEDLERAEEVVCRVMVYGK